MEPGLGTPTGGKSPSPRNIERLNMVQGILTGLDGQGLIADLAIRAAVRALTTQLVHESAGGAARLHRDRTGKL